MSASINESFEMDCKPVKTTVISGLESDAYGEIDFGTNTTQTAKYIKISSRTKVETLYRFLTEHWKLKKIPNLIISVTGGAKNFALRTRLKEVFRKSLIKASESTGAWITTGGTHAGVMKHVGKAVKNYAAIKDDQDRVVTIGIAPWGVIHEKKKLLNCPENKNNMPKQYNAEENEQGENVILDCNHSHFILVDDENEGRYGTEIDLRTKFEGFIAQQQTRGEVRVKIVCVIVQGGPGSLKTVSGSIEKKIPVVIVGGSGGWADILAAAYAMDANSVDANVVKELLQEHNVKLDPEHIEEWTAMVKKCISNKSLLSVFALDFADLSKDLDIAILEALLKADGKSPPTLRQLELAVAWNRSDIARSHILTDDMSIEKESIAKMFFTALQYNQHEFCKLFLNYGVNLKKYCTVGEIRQLYEKAPDDSAVSLKKSKEKDVFKNADKLMVQFLGRSYDSIYTTRGKQEGYSAMIDENKMDDPHRDIFQWAILLNYREIAMHIWECMFESMAAAIMATRILKKMAAKLPLDHEKKSQMMADADKYEELAAGILGQCFLKNPERTDLLLIGKRPKWGGYTCLHAAMKANDQLFVSRPGVQAFLDKRWKHQIAENTSAVHIVLAGLCPLLILTTKILKDNVKYADDSGNKNVVKNGQSFAMDNFTRNPHDIEAAHGDANGSGTTEGGPKTKPTSRIEKLIAFYNAPIVTFWMNVIALMVYLIFFAFVILSQVSIRVVSVSIYEYVLLGWITTFFLEELRQLFNQEAGFVAEKIKLYVRDSWNSMVVISLLLFYVGFGLRWHEQSLQTTLILYSLAFMTHCIHIVHIFAVHPVLGPKIIMLGKMLQDLLFFLFILIVFLLAYGVASQALLYPTEKNLGEIIVGIIYRPYWQIYGELFLDEVNYNPNLDDFTCSDTNSSLPRCPQQSVMVPIISAIYLLVANVLLLNLLIAMFSHTFENVERQSNEIWVFQRYDLLIGYCLRPPLVPPLIVLSHIYLFFLFLKRKFAEKTKGDNPSFHPLKKDLTDSDSKSLRKWERWQAEAYMRRKHREDNAKVDHQLDKLCCRIDSITSSIEDVHNRLRESGRTTLKRFERIEKKVKAVDEKRQQHPLHQNRKQFPTEADH